MIINIYNLQTNGRLGDGVVVVEVNVDTSSGYSKRPNINVI